MGGILRDAKVNCQTCAHYRAILVGHELSKVDACNGPFCGNRGPLAPARYAMEVICKGKHYKKIRGDLSVPTLPDSGIVPLKVWVEQT